MSESKQETIAEKRAAVISDNFDMINAIRRLGCRATRSAIGQLTGKSPATITRNIQELRSEGALKETDGPNAIVEVEPKYAYFLGIHVGTTGTRAVLSDFTLKAVTQEGYSTQSLSELMELLSKGSGSIEGNRKTEEYPAHLLKSDAEPPEDEVPEGVYFHYISIGERSIYREINHILDVVLNFVRDNPHELPFLSVCIAFPGVIDRDKGTIDFSPNIRSLQGYKVENLISQAARNEMTSLDIPWFIEHDTECTLLHERERLFRLSKSGEYNKQAFDIANKPNWAVLYFGLGIGASFCLDNKIFRGASNAVGEIGHVPSPRFDVPDLTDRYRQLLSDSVSLGRYVERLEKSSCEQPIEDERKPFAYYDSETKKIPLVYFYYDRSNKFRYHILAKELQPMPECACSKYNCLEAAIRAQCFDSRTYETFWKKRSTETLKNFHEINPIQYELLKQYVEYLIGIVIGVSNVDVLLISGTTLCGITQLQEEFREMKYKGALKQSANNCEIELGVNYDSSSARGAAIAAFYKCLSDNRKLNPLQPIKIFWNDLSI